MNELSEERRKQLLKIFDTCSEQMQEADFPSWFLNQRKNIQGNNYIIANILTMTSYLCLRVLEMELTINQLSNLLYDIDKENEDECN